MEVNRRTQAERSDATRTALIGAARQLFAEHGYGAVGTEAIVRAAGVTRGALYHQFKGKPEVFEAVLVAVEIDLVADLVARMADATDDPLGELGVGIGAWLDACAAPEVQRIVLLDGPSVLGWERWRELGEEYGAGLVEAGIELAIAAGTLRPHPVKPLAHVLIGALDEAALYVARAQDPTTARAEMEAVLRQLVDGLGRR